MTTIAANHECMAADSMASDSFADFPVTKVRAIGGSLFGGCGSLLGINVFFDWAERGMPKKRPKVKAGRAEFYVLELNERGLFLWENAFLPYRVERNFHAIGAGGQAAVALMMHKDVGPAEAVDMSCDVVPSACARPVDVYYLRDVATKKRKR